MSWLTDRQLERAIYRHGDDRVNMAFRGIYPLDRLPHLDMRGPLFIILNTDVENLPGRHWKAIYIDELGHGEIFDSLATPISDRLIRFMNAHSTKWTRNTMMLQHPLSTRCGIYVLYYVTQRMYYDSLRHFIKSFSHSLEKNEMLMSHFYKHVSH